MKRLDQFIDEARLAGRLDRGWIDEITAPIPPLSCPALVITGDEDYGNGPEMTRAIAAEIAGAQALILPGLRHMALAEDPPAVNRPVTDFLTQVLR